MRATGDDDRAAPPKTSVGYHAISVILHSRNGYDCRACSYGSVDKSRVRINEVNDILRCHEAVRIGASVMVSRQAALPVRRQQTQRVPAFVTPRIGDFAPLEH